MVIPILRKVLKKVLLAKYRGYVVFPAIGVLIFLMAKAQIENASGLKVQISEARKETTRVLEEKTQQYHDLLKVMAAEKEEAEKQRDQQIIDLYPSTEPYVRLIRQYAEKYQVSEMWLARIMECESKSNPETVNLTSQATGLMQFMPSTWQSTPFRNDNIFDPDRQVEAAAWMASEGREGEWECN